MKTFLPLLSLQKATQLTISGKNRTDSNLSKFNVVPKEIASLISKLYGSS